MSGSNFKWTIHLQVLVLPLRWQLLKQVFSFLIVCCNNNISLELQNYHVDNAIRGCMRAKPKQTKFLKSPSPYKGRSDCSHWHHLSIWIQLPWSHRVFQLCAAKSSFELKAVWVVFLSCHLQPKESWLTKRSTRGGNLASSWVFFPFQSWVVCNTEITVNMGRIKSNKGVAVPWGSLPSKGCRSERGLNMRLCSTNQSHQHSVLETFCTCSPVLLLFACKMFTSSWL